MRKYIVTVATMVRVTREIEVEAHSMAEAQFCAVDIANQTDVQADDRWIPDYGYYDVIKVFDIEEML